MLEEKLSAVLTSLYKKKRGREKVELAGEVYSLAYSEGYLSVMRLSEGHHYHYFTGVIDPKRLAERVISDLPQ